MWLGAIFRRPDRPPLKQRDVLVMLAVGVDEDALGPEYRTASIDLLDQLCAAGRRTVQRALKWARDAGLLRSRRGHWIAPGVSVQTRWQLVVTE